MHNFLDPHHPTGTNNIQTQQVAEEIVSVLLYQLGSKPLSEEQQSVLNRLLMANKVTPIDHLTTKIETVKQITGALGTEIQALRRQVAQAQSNWDNLSPLGRQEAQEATPLLKRYQGYRNLFENYYVVLKKIKVIRLKQDQAGLLGGIWFVLKMGLLRIKMGWASWCLRQVYY